MGVKGFFYVLMHSLYKKELRFKLLPQILAMVIILCSLPLYHQVPSGPLCPIPAVAFYLEKTRFACTVMKPSPCPVPSSPADWAILRNIKFNPTPELSRSDAISSHNGESNKAPTCIRSPPFLKATRIPYSLAEQYCSTDLATTTAAEWTKC